VFFRKRLRMSDDREKARERSLQTGGVPEALKNTKKKALKKTAVL